ncbi:MAG: RNB domain-containing ribonuclease [Burkholderiales bacterium]|nr:RNB domain-containing ribonuclease [Burkholderiales bacterium]
MNVLFEEQGEFKLGTVLADNAASLQVETASGKRTKVKAANVLLRFDHAAALAGFMPQAQALAAAIDLDFLWQCCGPDEFDFQSLAQEYYGRAPAPLEAAALLLKLHGAPMYFYRRGKGRFKAAPQEALRAALAAVERKQRQAEQQQRYFEQLSAGRLPAEFEPLRERLLYRPDRNTIEAKALDSACEALKLSPARVFERCGALPSSAQYHLGHFLFENFPEGAGFAPLPPPGLPADLPAAGAAAYSIDDAATTEIDDAFSVIRRPDGGLRVGVHIAAPALGIAIDSPLDQVARRRLSTVYMPGGKITMLPPEAIERYTLLAGKAVPALSFYAEVSPQFEILGTESRIESVYIEGNLRHDALDGVFDAAAVERGHVEHAFGSELLALHRLAERLEGARGKAEPQREPRAEYDFHVADERIEITERRRGAPIDKVVSELMILVNSRWGQLLDQHDRAGIFRAQREGKVKLATVASPHQGLGVAHYVWASSPLRRYVDLINQRQIVALVRAEPPPYPRNSEALYAAMRAFELTYDVYAEFQRRMERYWCLRWIMQENIASVSARVLRENLVRLERLPLVVRVPSAPDLPAGSRVELAVGAIDLIELSVELEFRERLAA